MTRPILTTLIAMILILGGCTTTNVESQTAMTSSSPNTATLTTVEIAALTAGILDEYRAEAIYQRVIADFGSVRPFANIVNSEVTHSSAIATVFTKYGLSIPENPHRDSKDIPAFGNITDACAAGIQAEKDNAALHEINLAGVTNPDVIRTLTNLRSASLNNHLPAFERCVAR